MNVRISLALALLCAAGFPGCASSEYLARVNDETVTGRELTREFVRRHGGHQKFLAGPVEVRKFLDVVIDWRLLIQEAYRLGLQENPEVVKAEAEELGRRGVDYLVRTEVEERARPTPEQVRAAWERDSPEVLQARQIVVETREEAEAIYLQVLGGADFETLARECSLAPSRLQGGRLPPVMWGMMEADWEKAAFALAPGETILHEDRDGWEVLQLESREAGERPPFEKVSSRIEGILGKRMLEERKRDYSEALWAKYHAKTSETGLDASALREAKPETVVAEWDGGRLTLGEVAAPEELEALARFSPRRFLSHFTGLLRATVNDALSREEVHSRGIDRVPEVVDAVRAFREDMMERMLYADFILKDVAATDEEIRAEYEAQKKDLVAPERRQVAHILVPTEAEAAEIRAKIAGGERFEDLARSRSKDAQTAPREGVLGWITKRDVPEDFGPVIALKEGEVSEPIRSKYGYHVVRVNAIVAERPLSLEESKEKLREAILTRKQQGKRKVWVDKLRAASRIRISKSGIRAFAKANAASSPERAPK
jgi:parvulin-like peptidyl-prolyl isomerase